jgi:hypothetical protein
MRRARRGAPDQPKSAGSLKAEPGGGRRGACAAGLGTMAAVMPVKEAGAGEGMGQARWLYATA